MALQARGFRVNKSISVKGCIYSPEFVARLLHRFISGAIKENSNGIKFELIYWLLPIVMNDQLRSSLKTASVKSSVDKTLLCQGNEVELLYINDYIENTKSVLNDGLIYLNSYVDVEVSDYINVNVISGFDSDSKILKEYYRSSYYLGQILAKEDYRNLYLKFGVVSI